MLLANAIPDDLDPAKLGLFAFAGLGVAAAGFSTAVYWRMQYVVSDGVCRDVCIVRCVIAGFPEFGRS